MKLKIVALVTVVALLAISFANDKAPTANTENKDSVKTSGQPFMFNAEKFADISVLRYQVPGFEELDVKQKEMLYYLYEAARCGRDIIWDQNCKYNLTVRHTLEAIVNSAKADMAGEDGKKFVVYAKRVWFSNGLHHHYSSDKIQPEFSKQFFAASIKTADPKALPLLKGESLETFTTRITNIIFDPAIAPKKVNLDAKVDMVQASSCNFYEGVTQQEVQTFYESMKGKDEKNAPPYGLNSKVVKKDGKLVEKKWKVGGMYTGAIEKIVYWLEKASKVAENEKQKLCLDNLIKYYKSGNLLDFNEYCINWVKDVDSRIDVVNGFIESYEDPLGYKASWESVVSIRDMEATKRIKAIADNAQWFEDNSPILNEHKKKKVTGISAKVITVVTESGDASPSTPIGINLPNTEWIREQHGSKSVNLGNIVDAYNHADGSGVVDEFYFNSDIKTRVKDFCGLADMLHTDMHEVIGHASGQLNPGIEEPNKTLKNYSSTLEEARADLVALYYLVDKKLVDIGVMPSVDYGRAAYDEYITKGLMVQLSRLKVGDDIQEAHMRNRQLVAAWAFEKGKKDNVIEKKIKDGKTFFVVNDYDKLRKLFGELLRDIQKLKSEGDYKAGKDLVENYGVKVDQALHKEVLDRYNSLGVPPYKGFINPKLVPVMIKGKITGVNVEYPSDFMQQMLEYGKNYSLLPVVN